MSLSAISTDRRNRAGCCDDFRPYIVAVAATTEAAAASTATDITVEGGDLTLDSLNVSQIVANEIISSSINTFELTTTFISEFTVKSGDDVVFFGNTSDDQFFWDSSASTLYIDGELKTRSPFITLYNDSSNNSLGITDADTDRGVLFKWFDNGITEEKLGFYGFDDSINRFVFNANVSVTNDIVSGVTEAFGDVQFASLFIDNIANEDISIDLNITSALGINMVAETGDFNISTTGNMSIDVNAGVFDLFVSGSVSDNINIENENSTIDIVANTSTNSGAISLDAQAGGISIQSVLDTDITSTTGDINLTSTLSNVGITAPNFNTTTDNVNIQTTTQFLLSTTGTTEVTFDEANGLQSNLAKTDYLRWIKYTDFDAFSGYWFNNRATPSSPLHSWQKEANDETAIIHADFCVPSRTTTDKGWKLDRIFFAYAVGTTSINGITPTVTLKTFDSSSPSGGIVLTDIPVTDVNLAAGTGVAEHYRSVNITTPIFINDESVLNIELGISTPAASVLDFYGLVLGFDRNSL